MMVCFPTTLTRPAPDPEYRGRGHIDADRALEVWEEFYVRQGRRPRLKDGHYVTDYEGLVAIAIFLNIPEIECHAVSTADSVDPNPE
jgi:hypothetical protein